MSVAPLSRAGFEELVKDLCADENATALDLSERLLGAVCQHQMSAAGLSQAQWLALCNQAWRICATEGEDP